MSHIAQMKIIKNSLEGIKVAAEILKDNGVVAFPRRLSMDLVQTLFQKKLLRKYTELKNVRVLTH